MPKSLLEKYPDDLRVPHTYYTNFYDGKLSFDEWWNSGGKHDYPEIAKRIGGKKGGTRKHKKRSKKTKRRSARK
jgi:hypothetical protein